MASSNVDKLERELDGAQPVKIAYQGDHCGTSVLPGPPNVRNIIMCELSERFAYYGMRAILVLYLVDKLGFSEAQATAAFLYWSAVCYFVPLLGGILADSFLGKYMTILSFTAIYWTGTVTLAVSALFDSSVLAFLGLALIALGTGGIKPCVAAFGALQVQSPAWIRVLQKRRRDAEPGEEPPSSEEEERRYFSVFYFSINTGSVVSYIVVPQLREHVGFPAAFGLTAVLLGASLLAFWWPRLEYLMDEPKGSVVVEVGRVISAACAAHRRRRGACWCCSCSRADDTGLDSGADAAGQPLPLDVPSSASSSSPSSSSSSAAPGTGSGEARGAAVVGLVDAEAGQGTIAAGEEKRERGVGRGGSPAHPPADGFVPSGRGQRSGAPQLPTTMSASGRLAAPALTDASPLLRPTTASGGASHGSADPVLAGRQEDEELARELAQHRARLRDQAGWLNAARGEMPDWLVEATAQVLQILPVLLVFIPFWTLFDQQGATWTLQAKHMKLYGLQPDNIGVLNPMLCLVFIPLYEKVLVPAMNACKHVVHVTPLRRVGAGMLLAAGSFTLAYFVQLLVDRSSDGEVSVLLQVPQYVTITFAEILVSLTGLHFAFSQAPASMQGTILALWYAATGLGDLLGGVLYTAFEDLPQSTLFLICAGLIAVAFLVHLAVSVPYKPRPRLSDRAQELLDKQKEEEAMEGGHGGMDRMEEDGDDDDGESVSGISMAGMTRGERGTAAGAGPDASPAWSVGREEGGGDRGRGGYGSGSG